MIDPILFQVGRRPRRSTMTRTKEEKHLALRRIVAERRWKLNKVGELLGLSYEDVRKKAAGSRPISEIQLQRLEELAAKEKELFGF